MKVLWVTNTIFPELSKALGKDVPVVGGWMYGLATDLVRNGVSLTVATARKEEENCTYQNKNTEYFLLKGNKPITDYDVALEKQWKNIVAEIRPDLVHIHGTEFAHGLSLLKACPELKYVVSIQGMTSVISRYYTAGIGTMEIIRNMTLRDILKWDGILFDKWKFKERGENIEKVYLTLTNDVIGRTQWDHDHVKIINPESKYHFCNESLRDSFYTSNKWIVGKAQQHSLFLTQAAYPVKGMHKVLEAMNLIKDEFPNLKLKVAKKNILHDKEGIKEKMKIGGYGKYVRSLIRKYKLESYVEFIGYLDERQMIDEYLKSHIHVCPSSIENSPNSIGEAQLLGVPCIASYVGGVPDMIKDGETGLLYRFEEVEMLAQSIKRIFTDDMLAEKLSKNGIQVASERHDRKNNLVQMLNIYGTILNQQKI